MEPELVDKEQLQRGFSSEDNVKGPSLLERAKEEIEAVIQTNRDHHHHHPHKETHGRTDDIDENTPIDEVKAPNLFERAKEEVEALVETIHPKKESKQTDGNEKGGFWSSLARMFEKVCSPGSLKKD